MCVLLLDWGRFFHTLARTPSVLLKHVSYPLFLLSCCHAELSLKAIGHQHILVSREPDPALLHHAGDAGMCVPAACA